MIDLLMHKSMMFTSESGKGVLLPFVWAEYLDATTATPPHLSRQQLLFNTGQHAGAHGEASFPLSKILLIQRGPWS